MAQRTGRRFWARIRRLILYRLIAPVLRARHPPEYTARGVLVGLLVALTPTVGVQMAIVALIWGALRALRPRWDFNVVAAMAWTWVTNVFTLGPVYYVFLVTGRLMLGADDPFSGYHAFSDRLAEALATHSGMLESLWAYTLALFRIWGLPMFVGSIPWALLGGWLGYRWTLRLIVQFRERRLRRAARRRRIAE